MTNSNIRKFDVTDNADPETGYIVCIDGDTIAIKGGAVAQVAAQAALAAQLELEEQVAEYEREQQLLRKAHPRKEHRLLHRLGECDGSCARFSIFR